MTPVDWTAIVIACFALAVFVAAVLAIPDSPAKIDPNQRTERQFTEHTFGKGKHANVLTCDDILAGLTEHRRSS